MATYIVAQDEYFGMDPKMWKFEGTFRELLIELTGMKSFTVDEEEDPSTLSPWHKPLTDWTDQELEVLFKDANGDGQPYIQVWGVEEGKQVLGGE